MKQNTKEIIKKSFDFILDCVFPKKCVGCLSEGVVLCNACRALLVIRSAETCLQCGGKSPYGLLCFQCEKKHSLELCISIYAYSQPLVRRIVHECKYGFIEELGNVMGHFLYERIQSLGFLNDLEKPLVLPIPLHKKKFLERSFNQAECIAVEFCRQSQSELRTDILLRTIHRPSQTLFEKKERLENIKGVFTIAHGETIKEKNIILIDDVVTSGATLFEAASVLANYHPKSIRAYTFAHG